MSGACTSTGDGCSRRPSDRPQSAHNTQPHGSAVMLGGTKASRSALAQACLAPAANTRDYLHSADGSEAHTGTRCINRISLIYSLSQINPPPAPRAGRTRAPAPRGATFSPSRSSPRTEKPPLAPACTGETAEDVHPSVPAPHGPRCRGRVTSPAEPRSASSAQPCVSIFSCAAAFPCAGGEGDEPRQSPACSFPSCPAPRDAAGAGGGPGAALGIGNTVAVVGTKGQPDIPCPAAPALPQRYRPPPQPYCSLRPPASPPRAPLQHYHPQPLCPLPQPHCLLAFPPQP